MMKLNRRELLISTGLALGARAVAKPLGIRIGLQPYTVRKELTADFEGTIKKLAEIGYEAIEVGDPFYGRTPEQVKQVFQPLGLTAPSGFYPYPKDAAAWATSIERAKALNVEYMITTIPDAWTKSLDGWKQAADRFNEIGAQSAKAGVTLAYHNHNFEYKVFDGKIAYDEFLRLTDPKLVKMEMDCFWTTFAGKDPLEYLRMYPGRFPMLHVKGLKPGFPASTGWPQGNPFTEVGSGIIDYKRIFQAAKKAGVKHYFVEQDNWDRPPLEAARISCEYLKKLTV